MTLGCPGGAARSFREPNAGWKRTPGTRRSWQRLCRQQQAKPQKGLVAGDQEAGNSPAARASSTRERREHAAAHIPPPRLEADPARTGSNGEARTFRARLCAYLGRTPMNPAAFARTVKRAFRLHWREVVVLPANLLPRHPVGELRCQMECRRVEFRHHADLHVALRLYRGAQNRLATCRGSICGVGSFGSRSM